MAYDQTIVTGEAVEIGLPLAGVGSRGIAALIDYAITTAVMLVALFVVLPSSGAATDITSVLTELLVTIVLVQLGYPVAMETLWRGRTLGKAAMGLRVVRDDGGPIRFRHAFVRGLVGVLLDKPGISSGLLALLPMLFSKRAKRLGDLAAGTIVLQERVPARVDAPIAMPPPLAGWAAGLDLSRVDEPLAARARQYLTRAGELNPQIRDSMERQLVAEVVGRLAVLPPPAPGWAVLAAVLAERRQRALLAAMPAPRYTAPGQAPYYDGPAAPAQPPRPSSDPPPSSFAPPG